MNEPMLLAYFRPYGKRDVDFSRRDTLDARAQSRHEILPVEAVSNPFPDVIAHREKVSSDSTGAQQADHPT